MPTCSVTLFTEDAWYRSSPFREPNLGHDGIRAYWERAAGTQRGSRCRWASRGRRQRRRGRVVDDYGRSRRRRDHAARLSAAAVRSRRARFDLREYWNVRGRPPASARRLGQLEAGVGLAAMATITGDLDVSGPQERALGRPRADSSDRRRGARGLRPRQSAEREVLFVSMEHLDSVGVEPGAIRENLTVEGTDVEQWPIGQRVRVGTRRSSRSRWSATRATGWTSCAKACAGSSRASAGCWRAGRARRGRGRRPGRAV